MAAMRRLVVLALTVTALSACDGGTTDPTPTPGTAATGSATGPTASPTASVTTSPTAPPSPSPADVKLPADAPLRVEDPAADASIAAGDLAPLGPPGSELGFAEVRTEPFEEAAFAWRRGDDPFAQEQGFAVWQRSGDAWVVVYAFTDKPGKGVLGISVQTGEITGDEVHEYLTFEQTGGSGACGTWRAISSEPGSARQVFDRTGCDTDVRIVDGGLEVREAVFEPEDPHCCPSAFRTSRFEWDGAAFALVSSEVVPAGG